MRDNYYLFGLGARERSYAVNGVTYQVGSRFTPIGRLILRQRSKKRKPSLTASVII